MFQPRKAMKPNAPVDEDGAMIFILWLHFAVIAADRGLRREFWCEEKANDLEVVVGQIVEEIAGKSNCTVFVTDSVYQRLVNLKCLKIPVGPKYEIRLRDQEDFTRPKRHLEKLLSEAKAAGSDAYVILVANGFLATEFLQYAERERLINTRGLFLLLHDHRLFRSNARYLWNRIINVTFVRRYNAYAQRSGETIANERIDLDTVYYPARKKSSVTTKCIDSWYHGRFRYGNDHYPEKISDLRGKNLRVAVFEHIPGVTEKARAFYNTHSNSSVKALGIEFELVQILGKALKFKPKYYVPRNIAVEKWGSKEENGTYTGLLREVVEGKADFYLGDLHYTPKHMNYFDLTTPYYTECLTFLTPESLTENSWKLLILPFRLYTWVALLLTLLVGGGVFYSLCLLYKRTIIKNNDVRIKDPCNVKGKIKGMYLFTEIQNSMLYTYGMLFQVSLPQLPSLFAVRILIGFWWIYSILVAVAYRASMTATLANPVARLRIDSLSELAQATIKVGGWSKESKDFFLMSSDSDSQEIGNRFELVDHEEEAIEQVANGTFCFYENLFLLRHARVKRQVNKMMQNNTEENNNTMHNLHVMEECAVHMPIALGLQKNSPLKAHVDIWLRRIIEVGLVEKWLSDVMEWSKINEIQENLESKKALVDLHKLQGAFIVTAVGYFLAVAALIGEMLYWKYIVLKDPKYDKYHLDMFYK